MLFGAAHFISSLAPQADTSEGPILRSPAAPLQADAAKEAQPGAPGALKHCQVRKRGNCCKANTKPFLSGAVKPPRPRQRFSSGAEPCSISVLLAKGTAEHGDVNALPKPLPGDSRGMAAVPWGSPSMEKPRWEQRRPRGRASSHRVPAEGLALALAVPLPLPSLHPRDKPHPSSALPQGPAPLPHHPVPSSCSSLPCRGGREGWEGVLPLRPREMGPNTAWAHPEPCCWIWP